MIFDHNNDPHVSYDRNSAVFLTKMLVLLLVAIFTSSWLYRLLFMTHSPGVSNEFLGFHGLNEATIFLTSSIGVILSLICLRSAENRQQKMAILAVSNEQLLKEKEALFDAALDSVSESLIKLSLDNRITYLNGEAELLLGYSLSGIQGEDFPEVFNRLKVGDDNAGIFHIALENLPAKIDKISIVSRSGYRRIVSGAITALTDQAEKVTGKLVVLRNETLPWRQLDSNTGLSKLYNEENLSEQEFLQKALDLGERLTDSKIAFVHKVDKNSEQISLTSWSTATVERFCNAKHHDHYPVEQAGIWADCIRTKEPVVINDYEKGPSIKGLPEGHANLKRFISMPVVDEGSVRLVIGVGNADRPYTEDDVQLLQAFGYQLYLSWVRFRHRADLKTEKLNLKKLAVATEESPASIVLTDIHGNIQYVNKKFTEVSGYQFEEVFGQNPRILKSDRDNTTDYEGMWKTLMTGNSWSGEFHNKRKDGNEYWESAKISPIKDDKGEVSHFLALKEDITELKKSHEKLKAMNWDLFKIAQEAKTATEAKNLFLANMSHELRTPMNGIMGMTQLLEHTDLNDEQRELLKLLNDCSSKLMGTIVDILEMGSAQKGELKVRSIPFVPSEVAEIACNQVLALNSSHPAKFKLRLDESLQGKCVGDPSMLEHVLVNLLQNAYKFTKRGFIELIGEEVDSGQDRRRIRFSIKDTGIGIPDDKLQVIYGIFDQVDNSYTREYGGLGIGLSIVRSLVQLMDGSIRVESTEGVGTTFIIEFYVSKHREPEQVRPKAVNKESPFSLPESSVKKGKVLIVDDDPISLQSLSLVLRKMNYMAECVTEPKRALEAVAKVQYDFIFLDIIMPSMDGFSLRKEIRQKMAESGWNCPIIANSAESLSDDRSRFLAEGFDEFVGKPSSLEEISSVLKRTEETFGIN